MNSHMLWGREVIHSFTQLFIHTLKYFHVLLCWDLSRMLRAQRKIRYYVPALRRLTAMQQGVMEQCERCSESTGGGALVY